MRRVMWGAVVLTALVIASAAPLAAQQAAAPAAATGVRAEALRQIEDAETKFLRLSEAMPAEKYSWRPGEGVRSVSEVYAHAAAGNYVILRRIGAQVPEGLDVRTFEQVTDKAKVREMLKQSFDWTRQTVTNLSDADTENMVQWGTGQRSIREVLFYAAMHLHEHLGQAIAYARVNGIVPPWTEDRLRQQQQQPAKRP